MDLSRNAISSRARRKICKWQELRKEFQLHKCLMHHYDVIDFTVFEFGMRVTYFVWRLLCALLFPLLPFTLGDVLVKSQHGATPAAGLIYMHVWLIGLLIISMLVDAAALTWALIKYPTCDLVNLQTVPWYFKLMWFLYNMLMPNVMSCALMYGYFSMKKITGIQFYMVIVMAFYAGVHSATTGLPSRLGHTLHPLLLTVIHLFFTGIYQSTGATDPRGHRYVYKDMDWSFRLNALLSALLWLVATTFFHISMVFASWTRRLLYRRLRKGREAVINPDPDDESSFCSLDDDEKYLKDQPSPRIWIEDIPGDQLGHKRVIVESPPPPESRRHRYNYSPTQSVFHEIYREPGGPIHPGDRRKRLIMDASDPSQRHRYCFAPVGSSGSPPRYPHHRSHYAPSQPTERSFICHPEISPDNKSMVYKCMPEKPTQPPQCFACQDDRHLDRIEYSNRLMNTFLPEDYPPQPTSRAHTFVVDRGPIQTQTFICPRGRYGTTEFVRPEADQPTKQLRSQLDENLRQPSQAPRPSVQSPPQGVRSEPNQVTRSPPKTSKPKLRNTPPDTPTGSKSTPKTSKARRHSTAL